MVVEVKAVACELPSRLGLPLSRLSVPDIRDEVIRRGIVAQISGTTIWFYARILEDLEAAVFATQQRLNHW